MSDTNIPSDCQAVVHRSQPVPNRIPIKIEFTPAQVGLLTLAVEDMKEYVTHRSEYQYRGQTLRIINAILRKLPQ
jgi:hypothetical protein